MNNYRKLLQELEIKAQEQYDKTVLMLSGGALGVSFTFLKDIISIDKAISTGYLIVAWSCWGISCACVLYSFYSSRKAMRKAIQYLDDSIESKNISDSLTNFLNFLAGFLFIIGLISMITFAYLNIGDKHMETIKLEEGQLVPQKPYEAPAQQNGERGMPVPEKPKDKEEKEK